MIRIIVDQVLKQELDREGRVDPLLQEEFHEGDAIAQCPRCKSWMLWQSWEDLGGTCACDYKPDSRARMTIRPAQTEPTLHNAAMPPTAEVPRPQNNVAAFLAIGLIAIIILGVFAAIATTRTAPSATFAFEVCNRSNLRASIAVLHYSDALSDWLAEGWWSANSGSCTNIGNFKKGQFYYYANEYNGNAEWPGDFGSCVRFPGPFKDRVGSRRCSSNEHKLFSRASVSRDKFTVNLGN